MSKHTPLPWHYTKAYGRNNPDYYIGKGEQPSPDGTPLIATVVQYEANAEYIVKACNTHQALVDALEAIVSYRDSVGALGFQLEKLDDYLNLAREALSKAKGDK